mgnify:CR=1 FL=1|jgi:hypothetical protein|tara:strand:+ start:745 stop:939 length:195 start_codon:yes stop_codon:yes gene_type:complete
MIEMFKGKDSETVGGKQVQQRLKDGWTFTPSTKITKGSKDKIKADAVVETKKDLDGPKDLTTEE